MAAMGGQSTQLRDGSVPADPRLDRLVQFDDRSREYPIRTLVAGKPPRSYTWRCGAHLDQGSEGACVEFGLTHELLARPVVVATETGRVITAEHRVYWPAQRRDPWPGGSYAGADPRYEGTSVLAGVQVVQELGYLREYRWAFGIEDLILAIGYKGPAVLGLTWRAGMMTPDADGFVHDTGAVVGGHCVLAKAVRLVWLVGVTPADKRSDGWYARLDTDRSYVTLHQSWGADHGLGGDVRISVTGLAARLADSGEACVPIKRLDRANPR